MILTESKVYICNKATDMRKSINGLSILIANDLNDNPTSGSIYVFWNRKLDKLKILYWHINGFCMLYKRLEKQRFKIPGKMHKTLIVTTQELRWLLDGLDFNSLKGHNKLKYKVFS